MQHHATVPLTGAGRRCRTGKPGYLSGFFFSHNMLRGLSIDEDNDCQDIFLRISHSPLCILFSA